MTYNVKTAIHPKNKIDQDKVVEFLESLGGRNELDLCGYIDNVYCIMKDNVIGAFSKDDPYLKDYTILNGVPQGWREEMTTEERMADKMLEMSREGIELQSKIDKLESEKEDLEKQNKELIQHLNKSSNELLLEISKCSKFRDKNFQIKTKINQLESENKELRECLSEIHKELELWVEGKKQFTSNSKALITQAKQLLNN